MEKSYDGDRIRVFIKKPSISSRTSIFLGKLHTCPSFGVTSKSIGREFVVLSTELAQQIAVDITEIIGHNVLITDATGIVLGSGERGRVGQFHEASIVVIETNSTRSHSSADVRSLQGSLPGTTLPLTLDGRVVGTVGLSGAPELVEQFGQIVKRQTEILMSEASRIGTRVSRQRAVEDFLRDVFDWHRSDVSMQSVENRAAALSFDIGIPRRVFLVETDNTSPATEAGKRADADPTTVVLEWIRHTAETPQEIAGRLSRNIVAVMPPVGTDTDDGRRWQTLVERGKANAWSISVGVGPSASGVARLNASAQDARDALELGRQVFPERHIHDIDRMRLLHAVRAVPDSTRRRLVETVLGDIVHAPDWEVLKRTLMTWGECGFNASKTAEKLHLHRNTLTYRLVKIDKLTGFTTLPGSDSVLLYIAALMHDSP